MQDDKDFKDYIETLPPELKQAIYSVDYPQKLQQVVKNNKLLIDQAGKLEAETTLVIAGIEPLDKYIGNLISHAGLTSMQASVVAHDVNELIFKNIRESLKKINDEIIEEDKVAAPETNTLTQKNVLAGIENPENIKGNEQSVSFSSMESKSANAEIHPEMAREGIEIKLNNLPEIAPEIMLPAVSFLYPKPLEPFHQNISPVPDIVESKLTTPISITRENIVIEEKTKLPEITKSQEIPKKPQPSSDPYREIVS